ncbi:hypothetical protein D0861_00190 [Hortaea werneckii]|uniref:Uncharacterized protein n=1 Tax=Hortaea werneckii TaxID=91943 RepID=A0A3M7G5I3_HORWE|nr:hypothetical protein D0861_00190 [Hortaea werneckii]
MAYQAQPGMHPGMAHGHPGMAPNPAQHMGQPMMHPGVSGPGQPHVSQAGAMMGVQPGASGPVGVTRDSLVLKASQDSLAIPDKCDHNQEWQTRISKVKALSRLLNKVKATPGFCILKVNLLADDLSRFDMSNGKDLNAWNDFTEKHFAPEGRLMHSFDDNPNAKAKVYEVLRPTIARYFWTYFESGAQSLRLHTEHARENQARNGGSQVSCAHATLTVSYPSGARLEMSGRLNALFVPQGDIPLIECLELQQTSTEEIISRSEIERVLSSFSPQMDTKSPKMTKNKPPKAQQKLQQRFDGLTIDHFPKTPKGTMGVTARVQQFLELGETMNVMSELMAFSQEKKMRPDQALEAWVEQFDAQGGGGSQQFPGGNPQIQLPPNGNRTPSMGNMALSQQGQRNFSSPSVSNLNLPTHNMMNGSPHIPNHPGLQPGGPMGTHTPSPHQGNMAAPPMLPQHSQQGTNSSGPSANTSPQVNNKRRRSTVKDEDGGGGPDGLLNQQRVKPSPRMTKKAKPGG